jgi:hypothetical protein
MQQTTTTTVTEIPDERRWQGRDWAKLGITGLLALALLRPGVSTQPEAGVPAVAATPVPVVVSTPVPTLAALAAPAILSTREAVFAGPYTVRGTGTPGSTVEVLVNGAPVGTAVVGADGTGAWIRPWQRARPSWWPAPWTPGARSSPRARR